MNTGETIALIKAFGGSGGGSSGGGVLVVHDVNGTLDKTWQQIHDADFAVVKADDGEVWTLQGTYSDEGEYGAGFWCFGMAQANVYTTDNPNGYPAYSE